MKRPTLDPSLPRPFLIAFALAAIAEIAIAGCIDGKLTPAGAAAIEAVDAAACSALLPLAGLPQGVDALACQGEEAGLRAALAGVTAVPAAPAPASPAPRKRAVHRRGRRGRVLVGYVPEIAAPVVQRAIDAQPELPPAPVDDAGASDAGKDGGS